MYLNLIKVHLGGMVWFSLCSDMASLNSERYDVHAKLMRQKYSLHDFHTHPFIAREAAVLAQTDDKAAQTDPCDWETKLEEWLLHQINPKVECALVCENTHLRSKVNELRREIDGQLDVHDKLRQENAKLRAANDELRSDNRCLQL